MYKIDNLSINRFSAQLHKWLFIKNIYKWKGTFVLKTKWQMSIRSMKSRGNCILYSIWYYMVSYYLFGIS
jgi:hypothetical protein